MKQSERVYISISRIIPKSHMQAIRSLVRYSNIKTRPEVWAGFSLSYSLGTGLVLSVLLSSLLGLPLIAAILFFAIFSSVSYGVFYFLLDFAVEQRTKQVEEYLPDALQLIAANLTAGMTPDKALFMAARPEFGVLSEEVKKMGEDAITGKSLEDALDSFRHRIRSEKINRIIGLLIEGVKSGGTFSSLLNQTADDMRMGEVIEEEIRSNVGMYTVFILMAVLIAAPLLYAVSINFVGITNQIRVGIGAGEQVSLPPLPGAGAAKPRILSAPVIDISFLRIFSIASLSISAFFGAILLGVLKEGEEKEGLKDIPAFVFIALIIFQVSEIVISTLLKALLT